MTPELQKALEEIKSLQSQLEAKRTEARSLAVAEAQQLIEALGITAAELKFDAEKAPRRPVRAAGAAAPKYKSPDGLRAWTGRGRTPNWVVDYLAADPTRSLDDLLI